MRVTLIVNPTASSVTPRARATAHEALAAAHQVEVVETERRGHATHIARDAARAGAGVVVVMGGDGTLSEAAGGLGGTETALAPLPGGSTNVYARAVGYSGDPVEATGRLIGALARGSLRRIGLGSVNGRRFLFHTGVGFDAAVVERVERMRRRAFLKRHLAHPLFVWTALATWAGRRSGRVRFTVDVPAGTGREVFEGCPFAIVSKIDPYTFLGPRPVRVAPRATLESPLALTAFTTLRLSTVLPAAGSALRKGRVLARHPQVVHRSHLHDLVVRADAGPVPYQVDGDFLGFAGELRFAYEPDSLTLVVPRGGRRRGRW